MELKTKLSNFNLADYKQQFIDLLKANSNFNNQKIFDLFEKYRKNTNFNKVIKDVNLLVDFLEFDSSWFTLIFKVQ